MMTFLRFRVVRGQATLCSAVIAISGSTDNNLGFRIEAKTPRRA
jgi:hypothetical protein